MTRLEDLPITRKVTLVILLTCSVVLLLACGTLAVYELIDFRRTLVRDMTVLADVLAKTTRAALAFQDDSAAQDTLEALQAERYVMGACLYTQDGRQFAFYTRAQARTEFPARPSADTHRFEGSELALFRPIMLNEKRIGTIYLRAELHGIYDRLRLFGGMAVLVLVISVLVAFVLSARLQRPISRPILALAETAHAIADRKDYSVRAVRHGGDEIGVLTDALNQVLIGIEEREHALRSTNQTLRAEVTDRTRAEDEVRQLNAELEQRVRERTRQLEAANKELESFSYSVSHDLRAPLRGIDGWSLALAEDYGGQLDERGCQYLERVRSEAQRMGMLIDDLLQLSRVTRVEMKLDPFCLSDLAQTIAGRLREANPNRQIEFAVASGMTAAGDPRLLEIALTNLMGNAAKFTGPRAEARIEVGQVGETVFYVRDNGVGFDMVYANTLFGAFQRLHKPSEFPGTGIGLATVQRIVSRHGGRIWAEAEPDKGAIFYFTLGAPNAIAADTATST